MDPMRSHPGGGREPWREDSLSQVPKSDYLLYGIRDINSNQLKDLIDQEDSKFPLLIFDLRPHAEFLKSRIENSQGFPLDESHFPFEPLKLLDLLKDLDSAGDLEEAREEDPIQLFTSAKHIVLYNDMTTEEVDGENKRSRGLFFDVFVKEGWKGSAYFLADGFKAFADAYPECIDSKPTRSFRRMLSSIDTTSRRGSVGEEPLTPGSNSSMWGKTTAPSSVGPESEVRPRDQGSSSRHRPSFSVSSKHKKHISKSNSKDDWSEIIDAEERRRVQNRIAQRKFSERNYSSQPCILTNRLDHYRG
jgi:hypothetical protein